jgi:uncharacterized protein
MSSQLPVYIVNTMGIALDVAPWLLLGLFAAGLIKAWLPEQHMTRWLGGPGILPVVRGALVGAPLPLCSCGAVPMALALHRAGASRGATTAFMVGTPGIGVDSLALTYALLGPFMAVVRAVAAVLSAIATGLLVALVSDPRHTVLTADKDSCGGCCASVGGELRVAPPAPLLQRTAGGLRYAFTEVLDDISGWVLLGVLAAGLLLTLVPPHTLGAYGSGPLAMLTIAVVGVPLYLCAQAATPIAAALVVAGISPGTALVLLLAGPITSLATLAVLRAEFGAGPVSVYLAAIVSLAVGLGVTTDLLIGAWAVDVQAQIGAARELLPASAKYFALGVLVLLAFRPLRLWVSRAAG